MCVSTCVSVCVRMRMSVNTAPAHRDERDADRDLRDVPFSFFGVTAAVATDVPAVPLTAVSTASLACCSCDDTGGAEDVPVVPVVPGVRVSVFSGGREDMASSSARDVFMKVWNRRAASPRSSSSPAMRRCHSRALRSRALFSCACGWVGARLCVSVCKCVCL